jgi:secondary thiamine-phosphate synthase enzyme
MGIFDSDFMLLGRFRQGEKMIHHKVLTLKTPGRGLTALTQEVQEIVSASGVGHGVCTVFVHHTSASLTINENADPDVQADLDDYLKRLVMDGDPRYRHDAEGPDDMAAHIRTALTQTSISIPVQRGKCDLGTWQGIFLWEHRTHSHHRTISVTVMGETP